jgi:hypothetical protein
MKGRDRRRTSEAAGDLVGRALFGCMIAALLASSVAVVSAARRIDFAPKIGAILVFEPGTRLPLEWEFATVVASGQLPVSCTLRPASMAAEGGSLVVEQRSDDKRIYRVHWAGHRTSDGPTDCGATADLLVRRIDLQLLMNAAGKSFGF